jgi:anti-sigma regulatory factor (Ser/Thr protein kinase)
MNSHTIVVQSEIDIITARMHVREMARKLGMNLGDQARISLAASSLAHVLGLGGTKPGQIVMECICKNGRMGVQVMCIERNGAGHADSTVSFGDTHWMVDEFCVERSPSNDLQVTLVKWLA